MVSKKKRQSYPCLDPYVYETSRLTHILDSRLIDGADVVSLKRKAALYTPGRFLVLISVRGLINHRTGRIRAIVTSNKTIGNRTRDLLAHRIVLQATTLSHGPITVSKAYLIPLKCPSVCIANGNNREQRLESSGSLLVNQASKIGDHLHISHKGTDNGILQRCLFT
jgi:hypothetical protein